MVVVVVAPVYALVNALGAEDGVVVTLDFGADMSGHLLLMPVAEYRS